MRRLNRLLLGFIFFVPATASAGESGVKDTIIFLRKLQTPGGGFAAAPTEVGAAKASLGATSSAVRTLRYLGGAVPNAKACSEFVASCFDSASGGFCDVPGGRPNVFATAVGMMAAVELKMPLDKIAPAAIKYLVMNANSFEDIRIAAAALESLGKTSSRNERWLKDIRKMRNADGTYGAGAGQARATGGAIAAVLRLGGKLDERDAVLQALKRGQNKAGGYGNEDEHSDLATTYRVMRAFMMLKSQPDDVGALRAFIGQCRNADGGYGVAPGAPSTVAGTYYATIIQRWLPK